MKILQKLYVTGIDNLEKRLLKIRESQAIVKKEVPLIGFELSRSGFAGVGSATGF